MSDKIARLGIERDNNLMYYIKNGDVWAVPRKRPGQPKGKAEKVASPGIEMDYSRFIYFLDGDGDVARKERSSGGAGRKPKASKTPKAAKAAKTPKTSKAAPPSKPMRSAVAPIGKGKKTEAQIRHEVDECLKAQGLSLPDVDDDDDVAVAVPKKRGKAR
jgi:hypothetical protein